MTAAPTLLQFQAISKRFGGTQAVDTVTLDVRAGEILAPLGENGAGKSTLIKLLAGIYPADSGEIVFDGRPQDEWRSVDTSHQPVAFIHQDLGLVEWMTVAENMALGWIVGKALASTVAKAEGAAPSDTPVLQLKDAASGNAGPLSLAVHGGEVLGLVGLRGAGHEAISRALFGREPLSAGQMLLQGRRCQFESPADAIKAGVAYVASERLDENLALGRRRRETGRAFKLIRQFDVNPPAPAAEAQQLSGGNQQKVVLARWFALDKPLVVLEEPTAGVDVGAKRAIYGLLRERAAAGTALVVVSTDFEEVATVCSRVLVLRNGLIAAELRGTDISVERLLALAAGGDGPLPRAGGGLGWGSKASRQTSAATA